MKALEEESSIVVMETHKLWLRMQNLKGAAFDSHKACLSNLLDNLPEAFKAFFFREGIGEFENSRAKSIKLAMEKSIQAEART